MPTPSWVHRAWRITLLVGVATSTTAAQIKPYPPGHSVSLPDPASIQKVKDACTEYNSKNNTDTLTATTGTMTINGQTYETVMVNGTLVLVLSGSNLFAGYTANDGTSIALNVLVYATYGQIAMAYTIAHELHHIEFMQNNSAFWNWAKDLDSCNGDKACIKNHLNAMQCAEADAAAKAAADGCKLLEDCAKIDGQPIDPACKDLTVEQKQELCRLIKADEERCASAMNPDPPEVDNPTPPPAKIKPPSCAAATVPEGITKPTVTCPPPCPCDPGPPPTGGGGGGQ